MRILHLVPLIGAAAEYGGPARGTMRQANLSSDRGDAVTVITLWRGMEAPRTGSAAVVSFRARRVPGLPGFSGLISLRALYWIWRNRADFDVLHVHAGRELWALVAMLIARLCRLPYVVQTHGMLAPRHGPAMRLYDRFLTAPAARGARVAMYLTNYERRDLERLGWFARLERVVNGVDAPSTSVPQGIDRKELQVVTTTRLHPRKAVPDLVAAAALVHQRGVPVRLTIYGPDEGDLENVLRAIRTHDAEAYVEIAGALAYEDVASKLRAANAYVLPSRAEPFPNSLLEALAAGLPCVCTSECGLAPYLQAHEAGIVVDPGSAAIADALLTLADPSRRVELAERALELARTVFSMDAIVDELEGVYALATGAGQHAGSPHPAH